jgi:hypothetical protein
MTPSGDPAAVVAAAVVPAALMSAGGLVALALYNRLAAIMTRLRGLVRERARGEGPAPLLGEQIPQMLRRARLVRDALSCLLGALAAFGLCSAAQGLSRLWAAAGWAALGAFLAGQLLLACGLLLALLELRQALRPVEMEAKWAERGDRAAGADSGGPTRLAG